MKQSLKAYLPKLNEVIMFDTFINLKPNGQKFIASFDEKNLLLKNAYNKGNDALVLIGPEGDFSKQEIDKAKQCNFVQVNIGYSRLRTETAALLACHTINLMNE